MSFSWKKAYKKLAINVRSTLTGDKPIGKLCDADDEIRANVDDVHNKYLALKKLIDELEFDGGVNPLPRGGETGQLLVKKSNANFDVEWRYRIYEALFDVRFSEDSYVVYNGLVVWREEDSYVYKSIASETYYTSGYVYVLFNAETKVAEIQLSFSRPTLSSPVEDVTVIAYVNVETRRVVYEHLGAVKYARD